MPKSEIFRLNYYVGAVLAQGGNTWFDESKIVFSPSSAIDRAFGASDIEIPFTQIKGVKYNGGIMGSILIKTEDKLHKFQGRQAKNAWEALSTSLKERGMKPMGKPETTAQTCQKCSGRLEPNFLFCPFCGVRIPSD